jgi:hypothetical protein
MGKKGDNMELIAINRIKANKYHCKNRAAEISNKLRASLIKTGQIKNIIVRKLSDETFEVVKGNTIFEMMKEEGFTDVWCFNLGEITLHEAWLIYLQTISVNEYNFVAVSELVNNLLPIIEITEIEKVTAFNIAELVEIKNIMNFNWANFNPKTETIQTSMFYEED